MDTLETLLGRQSPVKLTDPAPAPPCAIQVGRCVAAGLLGVSARHAGCAAGEDFTDHAELAGQAHGRGQKEQHEQEIAGQNSRTPSWGREGHAAGGTSRGRPSSCSLG